MKKGDANVIWWLGAFIIMLIILVVVVLMTQTTQGTAETGWEGIKKTIAEALKR